MRLNVALLIALLLSIAANLALENNPTRRNFEVLPEMVRSVAYESFSANPVFPDGKTMQAPVPGTVPRSLEPLDYAATPADAARAGEELASPFTPRTPGALERGLAVYQVFCLPCHGAAGKGDGAVAMRGFPAPPSLLAPNARGLKDGRMFHILTYGQKNMPSYAGQISRDDRWKVILYVRSLQGGAKP